MRTLFAAGILPERSGPEGELRQIRAAADAARREFERYGGHRAECEWLLAQREVERFFERHPGMA